MKYLYYFLLLYRLRKFKIDKWHLMNNYYSARYKRFIVNYLNKLSIESVLDIGCGIGEITRKLTVGKVFGLDIDERVIAAARSLGSDNILFVPEIKYLSQINKIDTLLMINWPHTIPSEDLVDIISIYENKFESKYIVIDKILLGHSSYNKADRFSHDFNAIFMERQIECIYKEHNVREIYIISK